MGTVIIDIAAESYWVNLKYKKIYFTGLTCNHTIFNNTLVEEANRRVSIVVNIEDCNKIDIEKIPLKLSFEINPHSTKLNKDGYVINRFQAIRQCE